MFMMTLTDDASGKRMLLPRMDLVEAFQEFDPLGTKVYLMGREQPFLVRESFDEVLEAIREGFQKVQSQQRMALMANGVRR